MEKGQQDWQKYNCEFVISKMLKAFFKYFFSKRIFFSSHKTLLPLT